MSDATDEGASRTERFLDLAKLTQGDFGNRRDLEWKLSLGLWGGLAAIAYFVGSDPILSDTVRDLLKSYWVLLIPLPIILVHAVMLNLLQHSHTRDQRLYWYYRDAIEKPSAFNESKRPYPLSVPPKWRDPAVRSWGRTLWFWCHILATTAFSYSVLMILAKWKA